MVERSDVSSRQHLWYAHGGYGGAPPKLPGATSDWCPGQPVHWTEQSKLVKFRCITIRVAMLLFVGVTVAYLQYRVRQTIGVFPQSRQAGWMTLQILFFIYECFMAVFSVCLLPDHWNIVFRNSVDFDSIPSSLIHNKFERSPENGISDSLKHYPSIDVIIPCYKEDLHLVRAVVIAALGMHYPSQLLSVYLCDDGKDKAKRDMVAKLSLSHPNVYYVTRPENVHAKPGNVNYTLKRTSSDLIVQLDADFIARPRLIQRLLSYYFVWNDSIKKYEFNDTLAVVQSPQFYRNLSPQDWDLYDQRNIFFFNLTLPGKDWFNTSTMVGTTNLLNRTAVEKAGYFPTHSFGDDTALSLIFHAMGYRTYYVNECLATGLCPSSLRGNFAQRARWYKTDSQIMFSKHGPLSQKGLSPLQRIAYCNLFLQRVHALFDIFADVVMILVLTVGFSVVDVKNTSEFFWYFVPYLLVGILFRGTLYIGAPGIMKSTAANEIFETVFKYTSVKGMLSTLFSRYGSGWKVAEKISREEDLQDVADTVQDTSDLQGACKVAVMDDNPIVSSLSSAQSHINHNGCTDLVAKDAHADILVADSTITVNEKNHNAGVTNVGASNVSENDTGSNTSDSHRNADDNDSQEQNRSPSYFQFVCLNLKRCWYNVLMAGVFGFAIVWAIVVRPEIGRLGDIIEIDGVRGRMKYNNLVALALSFVFAMWQLTVHVTAVVICFKRRYLTPWTVDNVVTGRCDQFAQRADSGHLYVPRSPVVIFTWLRIVLLLAGLAFVIALSDDSKFVPL